ncbi:MAG: hypothetical protein LBT59_13190 [Clostridiales bacterium]|jgi:hypothetical protein|nr:hypothetical protein [Clostridiales bacterium]
MKALILANVGAEHFYNGEILPSCFLPLYNKMTVIERQISLLNINGYTNDDICVLYGSGGIWDIKAVKDKINSINTRKLFVSKNNVISERIFESDFFKGEEVLLLEGNRVFDIALIARLRRYRRKNVLVVYDLMEPDDNKQLVAVEGDDLVSIKNSELPQFPWNAFAGVARLSPDVIELLKNAVVVSRPVLDAIYDVLPLCEIKVVKYDDLVNGQLNGGLSTELTGGSYSKLNYRLVVKKEDNGEGRKKLINEIEWLMSVPKELKPYFSEVLEYNIVSDKVFYNVPYYGSRNLREHVLSGHFDPDATCAFLENLLDWMFKNVYSRKISEAPDNWVMEKHVRRVLDRLVECSLKSEELGKIIRADKVIINNKEYRNVKEMFDKLAANSEFLESLKPKDLVMIHGDLHFQNILIYSETDTGFMLVDPRGERLGSDIYYDLGKLWHSFHGKYDFIHTDQFKYNISWKEDVPITSFAITNSIAERVYDNIYQKFAKVIQKYDFIKNDANWEMKTLFAEASHFCSVSTFHIGKAKTAERSIVLYLIGVMLINEFFERYLE